MQTQVPGSLKLSLAEDSPLGGVDIPKLSLTPQKWASSAKAVWIQRNEYLVTISSPEYENKVVK